MVNNFRLINPVLKGSVDIMQSGGNALDAASDIWDRISQLFANMVGEFNITLEELKTGVLHNFKITEKKEGDSVEYVIKEQPSRLTQDGAEALKAKANSIIEGKQFPGESKLGEHIGGFMSGGRKKHKKSKKRRVLDDSSSSSSSDSESDRFYTKYSSRRKSIPVEPVYYYWYDPSVYNIDEVYLPTFVSPLKPYGLLTYMFYDKLMKSL